VIGLYGVIVLVSQRTRRLGVRASEARRSVYRLIMREAAVVAGAGIALGLAGATVAASPMQRLLFGTPPWDVPTLAGVAIVLASSSPPGQLHPSAGPRQSARSRRCAPTYGWQMVEQLAPNRAERLHRHLPLPSTYR
jgi:hypothetical protein